jgi:alkanesulfonate monooxygenase SsuD/methylene tetrahydromethanopterin reductase-like flavin-dependent oxidoreductase (luciferase family)
MRFLLEHPAPKGLDDLVQAAVAAHDAGLDGVLVAEWPALPGALVSAAAVAARVDDVLVAAEVEIGARHPVEIAEEAAVTDLATGGRLVLVARPADAAPERYAESLDVIRHSFAARPFRFEGTHWRIPANLPENVDQPEERVRVTPAPAQPRLEVWGAGQGRDAALDRALGHLADPDDDPAELARAWARAETSPATIGAPRGRREPWLDAADLLGRLRHGRAAFGQDWACVAAPPRAAREIGSLVRPRVQLHRLTPGLEEFWDEERPWERGRR